MIRVGHGYDSHRLKNGEFIVIGGVKINSKKSVVAHSDGDVLIHALCDALLGSSGKGDMGLYFDSSEKYKNMDSSFFLKETMKILRNENYNIINLNTHRKKFIENEYKKIYNKDLKKHGLSLIHI